MRPAPPGEGQGDCAAPYRACAYAAAPVVLLWVPVGEYLAVLYRAHLLVIGLQRAQGFGSIKAVLTVVLGTAAGLFLSLVRRARPDMRALAFLAAVLRVVLV